MSRLSSFFTRFTSTHFFRSSSDAMLQACRATGRGARAVAQAVAHVFNQIKEALTRRTRDSTAWTFKNWGAQDPEHPPSPSISEISSAVSRALSRDSSQSQLSNLPGDQSQAVENPQQDHPDLPLGSPPVAHLYSAESSEPFTREFNEDQNVDPLHLDLVSASGLVAGDEDIRQGVHTAPLSAPQGFSEDAGEEEKRPEVHSTTLSVPQAFSEEEVVQNNASSTSASMPSTLEAPQERNDLYEVRSRVGNQVLSRPAGSTSQAVDFHLDFGTLESTAQSVRPVDLTHQIEEIGEFTAIDQSEFAFSSVAHCLQLIIKSTNLEKQLQEFIEDKGVSKKHFPNLKNLYTDLSLARINHQTFWYDILPEIRWGSRLPLERDRQFFRSLCYAMYSMFPILPFAQIQFDGYGFLDLDASLRSSLFSEQLKVISERIRENRVRWNERFWINLRKIGSKLNIMDANLHNIPFNAGTFTYWTQDNPDIACSYQQLRYPTPTIEQWQIPTPFRTVHDIDIVPEYLEFLKIAGGRGEAVLYSNHQSPHGEDEKNRIERLAALDVSHPNFVLVSLPVMHSIEDERISDIPTFCQHLERLILDEEFSEEIGFHFSPKIPKVYLEIQTKKWVEFLRHHFIQKHGIESQELRCVYLTMLEMFLRQDLARKLQVKFCNNTCKDAIDRGAIHLFCDVYWTLLMAGQEKDPKALEHLTLLTMYPAFGAKKQAILSDRLAQILLFATLIEKLTDAERTDIRRNWKDIAGIEKIEFNFALLGTDGA